MKKFILIFFLIIFLIEILSRSFSSFLLPDQTVFAFPNTKIRNKILIDRKLIIDPNNIKYIKPKFEGRPIPLINQIQKNIPHKLDKDSGAVDNYFYKDGFCNKSEVKNSKSIISIGDSFTYCTSVNPESAWVKQIFKNVELEKKINLGYPGSGPFEYNLILDKYLNKNNVLILYGFYEGNDLRDMINFKYFNIRDKIDENNILKEIARKIINNSYVGNLLVAFYKKIKLITKPNFRYTRTNFNQKFNINNSDLDEYFYAEKLFRKDKITNEVELSKSTYKSLLKSALIDANKIANKNKTEIIFLYLPASYSSFGDNIFFEDKKINEIILNYTKTNFEIFNEICTEENLDCLNLKDEFIKYNSTNPVPSHFPSNVHFTVEGHKIVSDSIEKYVCINKQEIVEKLRINCF